MWQDRKVVITGGSSGLGLALAETLAERGAMLGLIGRDAGRLAQARIQVLAARPATRVVTVAADVSDEAMIGKAITDLGAEFGGIDVLINSAGIDFEDYFELTSTARFRQIMDINFFGTLYAIRAALPALRRSQGRIVNIASAAGLMGVFGYSAYTASKHAVMGLSDGLRYELKPQGIRVQVICPTEFDSPLVDALHAAGRGPENRAQTLTVAKISLPRMTELTLRLIESNRYLGIPGRVPWLTLTAARLFPGLARWLGDRTIAKHYVGPQGGTTA